MPTINYSIPCRCWNCGHIQHADLPKNHSLIPYNPLVSQATTSSYYNRYRSKMIEKRCENCRESKLVPMHTWDITVRKYYESKA